MTSLYFVFCILYFVFDFSGSSASPVLNLSKGCEGVNNNASVSNEDKEIEHHQHSHQDLLAVRDGLQQEEEARRVAEEESAGSSGGEELPSPRPHHHHALVHHPSLRRHDGDDDHSDVNDDDDVDEEKHGKASFGSIFTVSSSTGWQGLQSLSVITNTSCNENSPFDGR